MATDAELAVLGTSGHAREILAIAAAAGIRVRGCTGPYRPDEQQRLPVPYLGDDDWWTTAEPELPYLIGVGAGRVRAMLDLPQRRPAAPVRHPAASVGPRVELGPGCVVWPGAVLTADVRAGRHAHIGTHATVAHDSELADYVTVLPGATVCGGTRIGATAVIGAGATVIDGVNVGAGAFVGAGAVVIRDVDPGTVVVGIPARPLNPAGGPQPTAVCSDRPNRRL